MSVLLVLLLAGCPNSDTGTKDTGPQDDTSTDRYHPDGWSDPAEHGMAAKLQDQACTACHGDDLGGGSAGQSCDTCHASDWRTDCTFCHGGTETVDGAPPEDIDDQDVDLSFPEHTAHVVNVDHPAWTCDQCHATPDDVLSSGHIFVDDDTPGAAEVGFGEGLSAEGAYASGSCSNLYCHGDGQAAGSVASGETLDCGGCHGSASEPGTLSAAHPDHLGAGITCEECHGATADGSDTISGPDQHVDGEVDVELTTGMTYADGTCTGTCHDVVHDGRSWTDESYHPAGWDDPDQHGLAAKLQTDTCTTCHGDDLDGGTSGQGCDTCHEAGWRTDCTYCHGGDENGTGAPPEDIDPTGTISFPEHSAHVTETIHAAWDCDTCHVKPEDVLSDGHVFLGDTTPGAAEVVVDGSYSAGSCSNLYCHGDGQTNGDVASGDVTDCGSCHGTSAAPGTLSTVHPDHLDAGATCAECHAATVSDDVTVSTPALHVDGVAETEFPSGMVMSGGSCTGTCHDVAHEGATWSKGGFHPLGWDAADQHGLAADLQTIDCTGCHGTDLRGGTSGQSCDACHAADWRTDCTYCHGGDETSTGAPPEDIDPTGAISFPEHTAHVTETIHAAWDCVECHAKPTDVLSDGHIFIGDTTPGAAEVVVDGSYSAGTCSNLYCHGDGVTPGSVSTGETTDCGSCHGTSTAPGTLSTVHADHFDEGATCDECHAATVSDSSTVATPALHVNGAVETEFPSGMVYSGGTCTGTCHGTEHTGSTWTDGGFHDAGWEEADRHGLAANLRTQDCTSCHGDDLAGGTSGQGCDECHTTGWRTDCVYCHGGEDNSTGAPPVDIDGGSVASFPEHGVHVTETNHAAWDCVECHQKPEDVLSDGHVFLGDTTPGVAEVELDGSYAAGTCSNLYCHGDGQSPGSVSISDTTDCGSCHGTSAAPGTLSTVHADHFEEGATCDECHAATVSDETTVSTPALHVDRVVETEFPSGMVYSGGSCTGTCHGTPHNASTWTDGGFHPEGWEEPDQHGLVANLQEQDCTGCHGADLTGGTSGESCDECHEAGWRTDCTYCHGGVDNTTGAPPTDIDGSTTALAFGDHTAHVEAIDHGAWDCEQCHVKPTDVLSDGHVFVGDTTPAEAEVDLHAGLSPDGAYSLGTCSNLYCHGDTFTAGSVTAGDTLDCGSCHGSATAVGTLSAAHGGHLSEGITCGECHSATASGSDTISGPDQHVDGEIDVALTSGMSYSGGLCTGTCHGTEHSGTSWTDGFHPEGWEAPDQHGLAANLQEQTCTDCHGEDLLGGTSGQGCDDCHTADWRTDCTYCHGGVDNTTGAPPTDIDGSSSALSFDEHTVHIEELVHKGYDCDMCHQKPEDVLSDGHVFLGDTTPGAAEIDFSASLSDAGTYLGSGSCSNLYCHGNGWTTLGSVATGDTETCSTCHGSKGKTAGMSGEHGKHLGSDVGASCGDCHSTVASGVSIATPSLHVDGTIQVSPLSTLTWTGSRCTGSCHGEAHSHSDPW